MYVLFPAEEIVEFTLSRVIHTNLQQQNASPTNFIGEQQQQYQDCQIDYQLYKQQREDESLSRSALTADRATKTKSKKSKASRAAAAPGGAPAPKMAASNEVTLRDLQHPALNDALKNHNAVTFKLVRTVSDFTQQLSQIYGQHAEELQLLVSNFRKRNSELRKERPNCPSSLFHTWETLLQEVEIDSQTHGDVSVILTRQVSRPLLERSFHRKIQSRKVFAHRENFEAMLNKQEDALSKSRQEYKSAYLSFISSPGATDLRSAYLDTHNTYVQSLTMTNAMLEQYHQEALPQLLQELEEIYTDLCSTMSEAVLQGAEIVSSRAIEQSRRYDSLTSQCRAVLSASDLAHFVRSVSIPHSYPHRPALRHNFVTPQPAPPDPSDPPDLHPQEVAPASTLKNELVLDRLASLSVRTRYDALKKEAAELDAQIRQLHDALDTLLRIQQRSLESNLYNKANELQEDISVKRFDLRATQIRLNGINAQKELFATKVEGNSEQPHDRKMSSSSQGSMKTKWLKAFKSLKTTPSNGSSTKEPEKKNGRGDSGNGAAGESVAHSFQEYTYKKITPCDVCSQVLRGHTRQGMRCRVCKLNVHLDCQEKAPRCQQKSRLLRRQKSTSEIDTRLQEQPGQEDERPEMDTTYQVLKQAGEISRPGLVGANAGRCVEPPSLVGMHRRNPAQPLLLRSSLSVTPVPHASSSVVDEGFLPEPSTYQRRRLFAGVKSLSVFSRSRGTDQSRSISLPESVSSWRGGFMKTSTSATSVLLRTNSPTVATPTTSLAPHSPRRQKLNLRMKSLSLDSPESTEHVQRRRQGHPGDPTGQSASVSRIKSPSSPVHNRRLLSARNMRMSSVELPDDNEKSLSSASTSPCPSPKPHRLLPTNLYVVLYNFKSRHPDELDLKAGYKVTVIDTSDVDWWKGKCLGRVGFFPSKYVIKLQPGERPLQVTHNLQVCDDADNGIMLLRDQVVIQVGEELDGMVMIRNADSCQGVCPLKFLQEV